MAIDTIDKLSIALVKEAEALTKLLKDEIRRQDLIDTGRMLRETAANIDVTHTNEISIKVISTTYYKYVDGRFKITKNALKGPKFEKIVKKMNDMIAEYFENQF